MNAQSPSDFAGPPQITDHALLRYLERVHLIDIERVRAELLASVKSAIAVGAKSVVRDGVKFQIERNRLVTCFPAGAGGNVSPVKALPRKVASP